MANAYFIDETYFKEVTPVNLNVDVKLIKMSISDAQDIHIQTIIGTKLYRKLETLIVNGKINLPENLKYKNLLNDYIQQATTRWALYEATTYIRYKMVNKGVQSQTSDNSSPVELSELNFIQERIKNTAEFYSQRIIDFLKTNKSEFPEYKDTCCNDIQPANNAYFCGLVLDN